MKRLLAISPVPTHPSAAGSRARVLSLLDHLDSLGWEVHFLYCSLETGDEAAMCRHWGERWHMFPCRRPRRPKFRPWYVPYWIARLVRAWRHGETFDPRNLGLDDWYDRRLDPFLRSLQAAWQFDAVLVEYVYLSRALSIFPANTLKLLDTLDVFADRYKIQSSYYSCSRDDEGRALRRADAVLAIQDEEARYFQALSDTPVLRVGHPAPIAHHGPPPQTPVLLFVAGSSAINREAVHHFCSDILPRIREKAPTAELRLVGSICGGTPDTPGVVKYGELPSLDEAYAQARCVLNMRRVGTGLSIKSIEALAHGRPLVSTPAGVLGLADGANSAYLVAEDDEAFARAVVSVLQNDALAAELAANAQQYAHAYCNACFSELDTFLAQRGGV